MNWINWIIIAMALYGAYLNAKQNEKGFILWIITNSYLSIHNLMIEEYAQACLFFAYLCICISGYITWRKKGKEKTTKKTVL